MSDFIISLIDGVAGIIYFIPLIFSLINYSKTKNYLWVLVSGISFVAILASGMNVLEWSGVTPLIMDLMEDFFVIFLYLFTIIFAIGVNYVDKNKGKNRTFVFMFISIIAGIFIATVFIFTNYFYFGNILLNETSDMLVGISKSKVEGINEYLSKLEEDILILQESNEVKELLKKELVFDEDALREDVEYRARIISKEIENYVRLHPEMTLDDLQKSSEFQKIAVQPVGKDGYSGLSEVESLIIYLHKDLSLIGFDLHDLEKSNPGFFGIVSRIKYGEKIVDDFYDWKESSGEVRKKYGSYRRIPAKSGDDKILAVAVTAYLDDYKSINSESEFLENFNKERDYYNVVLVSSEGHVPYMVDKYGVFGGNLKWETNLNHGLSKNYFNINENEEISFYGSWIDAYGDTYPKVSILSSVYENKKLLGYVGIVAEMDKIFDITEEIVTDYETEESYLINENMLLISQLRSRNFDIFVQSINTESAVECLENFGEVPERGIDIEGREEMKRIKEFLDYKGELVFGKDAQLEGVKWCLLTEIDKKEAFDMPLEKIIKIRIYFSIAGVLIIGLIGFFIGIYFDKNIKENRRKK